MKVIVRKIVNTYGLKGALKVYSTTDFAPLRYQKNAIVTLYHPQTHHQIQMTIASYRNLKGMDIITFKGLEDINLVQSYVGYEIHVEANRKDLPQDSYFYQDLIDCEVFVDNQSVGKVIEIQNCGNQYNLRIQNQKEKSFLYPFIHRFLKNVDILNKRIDLNPIKGMIPHDDH